MPIFRRLTTKLHGLATPHSGHFTIGCLRWVRIVRVRTPVILEPTYRGVRCLMTSTPRYRTSLRTRSQKWPHTWRNHGGTERGLITEVGWNLISCAGCKHVMFRTYLVFLLVIRFCLERLGVVRAEDHTALVIKVFWRCAPRPTTPMPGCCNIS